MERGSEHRKIGKRVVRWKEVLKLERLEGE